MLWLLSAACVLFSVSAHAEFFIKHANTFLKNDVYHLNAQLNNKLTPEVIEALNSGVAITLELAIDVRRVRSFWWDNQIASLRQRYQLRYYPLNQQYVVLYLNTGIQETFLTLNAALSSLGNLKDFPLLDKTLIQEENHYQVYLQLRLDIEALPAPLRPIAYFSSGWLLDSEWFICDLTP
ncbi:hypothetical protein BegalDRAFT_0740 [Beggiatoa alba B18LD]|uniref:Proline rich signal peptide protein n=2 Tax=Beggiatoa alba TaxID=1022 RepID=I3CDF9_9GAMM|nr:hypothetical protein BegalDRAFT_0740 [Beggiatoa alba B18LD]